MVVGMSSALPESSPARAARTYGALLRLAERHGSTAEARARQSNDHLVSAAEAVRLVTMLGAGSATYLADEEPVDAEDLVAALTLMPLVRTELDEIELALLRMARAGGMTWSQIASGLGLRSPQAVQQRHDRLAARQDPPDAYPA
jgi:hypothetical protein